MGFPTLTLYPLQLGAPERHGQVKRDEVLVVAHRHQEIKLHFSQHLKRVQTHECDDQEKLPIFVLFRLQTMLTFRKHNCVFAKHELSFKWCVS